MSIDDTWERRHLRDAAASDRWSPEQLHSLLDEVIEERKKQKEAGEKARQEMRTGVLKPLAVQVWHPPGHSNYNIMIVVDDNRYWFDLLRKDKLEDFVTLDEE